MKGRVDSRLEKLEAGRPDPDQRSRRCVLYANSPESKAKGNAEAAKLEAQGFDVFRIVLVGIGPKIPEAA